MIAPTGEQITITAGDQEAVVVEVGGGLRSYTAGGRDLIDGYKADEMSSSGRGQVLVPWPNRLQDGSYEFDRRRHQLPLNEPERRNAIHGLVRWATWTVAEPQPHRAVMKHVLLTTRLITTRSRGPFRKARMVPAPCWSGIAVGGFLKATRIKALRRVISPSG